MAVHVYKEVIELLMMAAIPAGYQLPKPIGTVDERFLEAILGRSDDSRAKEWKLLIQGFGGVLDRYLTIGGYKTGVMADPGTILA